jgi:hypothetical protein
MKTLAEQINDLNNLISQGKAMEGFEKYYHEDVIMQENENEPTIGKQTNRLRETEFFNAVTEFRKALPLNISIGENLTMVLWHFDYTHKDWGVRNYKQVSVQEWNEDKIIKETFYYGS